MIVDTARAAAELLAPLFGSAEGEAFAVLHLDADRRLLATLFGERRGGVEVVLPVREILAAALRAGSASVIVAHNHMSGDAEPGEEDRQAVRRLADGAAALGVQLADHFIFAGGQCRSFREMGLL